MFYREVWVAVLEGKLYAVGGEDGSSKLSSVERYDPATNKWEAVAPMGSRRKYLGVAACLFVTQPADGGA